MPTVTATRFRATATMPTRPLTPGAAEIPGNGVDDDCSLVTPDSLDAGALECDLVSNRQQYDPLDLAQFTLTLRNPGAESVNGVSASYALRNAQGALVASQVQAMGSLLPGGFGRTTFGTALGNLPPGWHAARVEAGYAGQVVCADETTAEVLSSSDAGPRSPVRSRRPRMPSRWAKPRRSTTRSRTSVTRTYGHRGAGQGR